MSDLDRAVGKTVQRISQAMQDHQLDGPDQDGEITLEFTDGSRLIISGYWQNDGTAATDYTWEPPLTIRPSSATG